MPPDFIRRRNDFMRRVPDDWRVLFIGNGTLSLGTVVAPGVRRCISPNRTHCWALRGEAIQTAYEWARFGPTMDGIQADWIENPINNDHIDHVLGPVLARLHPTYSPDPILAGQRAGVSDIMGQETPKTWFGRDPNGTTGDALALPIIPRIGDKVILADCGYEAWQTLCQAGLYGSRLGFDNISAFDPVTIRAIVRQSINDMLRKEAEELGLTAALRKEDLAPELLEMVRDIVGADLIEPKATSSIGIWEKLKVMVNHGS